MSEPGTEPRRLSPLTPLVRGGILVVAMVATTWDDLLAGRLGPIGLTLLGVLVVGGVIGWTNWLRTTYWIEGDELRIDTGLISRQSRQIRIDRLQGVDIVQPAVARVLGLAELRMDTAGGAREGSLAYLPLSEATALRHTLLARRDEVRRPGADGEEDDFTSAAQSWTLPDHDLATLDPKTLVLSLILSPATVAAVLVALAFAGAFAFAGVAVFAPIVPVVVGFVLVQARRLSAFWGFTLSRTRVGLQVRRGLLERTTQTINLARVQGIVVTEPFMWRPLGWARLDVSVAGYGQGDDADGGPSATTVMPVGDRELVLRLATVLLGGEDPEGSVEVHPDAVTTSAPPVRARWLDPVGRRFLGAGIGTDLVASRRGRFTRTLHVVRHARVQSFRLAQGPLQRRLGLADVHLDSPPGPVDVRFRHRDAHEARAWVEEARVASARARAAH